jgi:hypothetical protein
MRFGSSFALLCTIYGCSSAEPQLTSRSNDALSASTQGRGSVVSGQGSAPGQGKKDDALAADGGALPGASADAGAPGVVLCGNAPCECNNGIDDDGDGNVDGADIECTGALDDEEQSFGTGIPGDNKDPKWQDCFFDGNSGHGDDRCRYPTGCLTGELSQDDPACAITQACLDECFPQTPAGCDCFGCCTVEVNEATFNIRLTDSCTADQLGDPDACPVCTKSSECNGDDPPPAAEEPPPAGEEPPPADEEPPPEEEPPPADDPADPPVIR